MGDISYTKNLLAGVLPRPVRRAIDMLGRSGYEAFIVGGCVRDCLMGRTPGDWDVCTSARPDRIKECFREFRTVDTGLRHGTVTVLMDGESIEITTFRIDGDYQDGRHPDSVEFTASLEEDLARRDFTINAMAFHPDRGLIDPYGGEIAVRNRTIACVGMAETRFGEDALRIMRGLRFAATLDFSVDGATEKAMRSCGKNVGRISRERVSGELGKLLLGPAADRVLLEYGDILSAAVPGLSASPVNQLPQVLSTRLAAVFPKDTDKRLRDLKFSSRMVNEASALARLSVRRPPRDSIGIKKILASEGKELTYLYFAMFGKEALVQQVLDSGQCWNLKQLAVGGRDLVNMGIPRGREVGALLEELLQQVIEEKLCNDRQTLLEYSRKKVCL